MADLLNQVIISPTVYHQWMRLAQEIITKLPPPVDPQAIGDEEAERQPDGSLIIFATYKGKRVAEMIVPREHWTWRFPTN